MAGYKEDPLWGVVKKVCVTLRDRVISTLRSCLFHAFDLFYAKILFVSILVSA